MRKYFDFNSFEKQIKKSLFEGIDLDDEIEDSEDVQFEKPAIQNDLFKQEQFRMMMHSILQPLTSDTQYKILASQYGSYNKDEQQHYTYIICSKDLNNFQHNYMFDYCFETNNLTIYEKWETFIDITYIEAKIIAECKFPVNIYIGTIEQFNEDDDLYKIVSNAPNIATTVCSITFVPTRIRSKLSPYKYTLFPHKFFNKFKGFVTKYSSPTYYKRDLHSETIRDLEKVDPHDFFEVPSDYEKFNKFRLQAIK